MITITDIKLLQIIVYVVIVIISYNLGKIIGNGIFKLND